MFLVYKNVNDDMKFHYGRLLTNPHNISENTIYVDVSPMGTLKEKQLDWKNQHISSIGVEHCVCLVETEELIRKHLPEHFL